MDAYPNIDASVTTGKDSLMPSSLPLTFRPESLASSATSGPTGDSPSHLFTGFASDVQKVKLSQCVHIQSTPVDIVVFVELENTLVYTICVQWPESGAGESGWLKLRVVIPSDADEGAVTSVYAEGSPSTGFPADFAIGPQNFVQKEAGRTFANKVRQALKTTSDLWLKGLIAKDKTWESDPIVRGVKPHVNRLLLNDMADAWK